MNFLQYANTIQANITYDKEWSGYITSKGDLKLFPSKEKDFSRDFNKEITWHSHWRKNDSIPSPKDLQTLLNTPKTKIHLLITQSKITLIERFKISQIPLIEYTHNEWIKNWKKIFKSFGYTVKSL